MGMRGFIAAFILSRAARLNLAGKVLTRNMTILALLLATACSSGADLAFPPLGRVTRVEVSNAVGVLHTEKIRDARTVARLVAIMDRYRTGWGLNRSLDDGPASTCAYGVGFYDGPRWIAGVSIGSDGLTVSRAQIRLGTLTAYKFHTPMAREMLAALGKRG
jgi:hypothetical protein